MNRLFESDDIILKLYNELRVHMANEHADSVCVCIQTGDFSKCTLDIISEKNSNLRTTIEFVASLFGTHNQAREWLNSLPTRHYPWDLDDY